MDDLVRFLSFSGCFRLVDAVEQGLKSSYNKVVTSSPDSSPVKSHNHSENVAKSNEDLVWCNRREGKIWP